MHVFIKNSFIPLYDIIAFSTPNGKPQKRGLKGAAAHFASLLMPKQFSGGEKKMKIGNGIEYA